MTLFSPDHIPHTGRSTFCSFVQLELGISKTYWIRQNTVQNKAHVQTLENILRVPLWPSCVTTSIHRQCLCLYYEEGRTYDMGIYPGQAPMPRAHFTSWRKNRHVRRGSSSLKEPSPACSSLLLLTVTGISLCLRNHRLVSL